MNIRWVKTPCKDCKDRHEKCHASCEAYNEYLKEFKAEKTRIYMENRMDAVIKQINCDSAQKKTKIPEPLRHWRKKG